MDLSERPGRVLVQRHPWERSRFRFFRGVLQGGGIRPGSVLDVGAGDAWFAQQLLRELPATTQVICWDAHYEPAVIAELGASLGARASFTRERPRQRFDLIILLDVLEHVQHDREMLSTLVQENLNPHGRVLVSVPAWQPLFTQRDVLLRHHRRYAPRQAAAMIEASGLTIVQRGGLFHSLLLPRALEKARASWSRSALPAQPESLAWSGGPSLTRVVDLALAADNWLSRVSAQAGLDVPGLSWWALCKRR